MISLYQGSLLSTFSSRYIVSHIRLPGAAIMIISLVLFENEFLNIVAIFFTALILNELIMVALEITIWYVPSYIHASRILNFGVQARIHDHFGSCRSRHLCL
jgi:hypothetical protein